MLSFSQCEYNPHIAVQLSIYTVYIESSLLHAVLFTITLPSFLSLLFTYAFLLQRDIFSQLLPNWLYNNVYSISSTYTGCLKIIAVLYLDQL